MTKQLHSQLAHQQQKHHKAEVYFKTELERFKEALGQ